MQANVDKIQQYVDDSLMLATALNPIIGYDKATKIAHTAHINNITLKQAACDLGLLNAEEFRKAVDPQKISTTYCTILYRISRKEE